MVDKHGLLTCSETSRNRKVSDEVYHRSADELVGVDQPHGSGTTVRQSGTHGFPLATQQLGNQLQRLLEQLQPTLSSGLGQHARQCGRGHRGLCSVHGRGAREPGA